MSLYAPKDSQEDRRYQRLKDQHGRTWGCVIELSTGDPTGPIDLLEPKSAPVLPAPRYMKVNSKTHYGELRIDYTGWKAMQRAAWEAYDKRMLAVANEMYGDAAPEKMEQKPPALIAAVGVPPEPMERILAAEAGDPWALGLTAVRPDWADRFFPPDRPKVTASNRPAELAFLDYKKPGTPETEKPADTEYPTMYAPGRWRLSDGTTMQGKKAEAVAAEAALKAPHPSWGDA